MAKPFPKYRVLEMTNIFAFFVKLLKFELLENVLCSEFQFIINSTYSMSMMFKNKGSVDRLNFLGQCKFQQFVDYYLYLKPIRANLINS